MIVVQGSNDIVQPDGPADRCTTPSPGVTAEEIIAGHRQLIRDAHARDIKIIGGTLPPYHGFAFWTERGERVRTEVNDWIRTSGAYDDVVDFDRAVTDPDAPAGMPRIKPEYAADDRIHLNDAGYQAMADAVDLDSL